MLSLAHIGLQFILLNGDLMNGAELFNGISLVQYLHCATWVILDNFDNSGLLLSVGG